MAILFKEQGSATRISVRTKPGGVDATVLDRDRSAAAAMPGPPERPSTCPSADAIARVLAEADGWPTGSTDDGEARRVDPRSRPPTPEPAPDRDGRRDRARPGRAVPGSTASSSWPSRPGRRRTTSSPSSDASPRPSGSATAARSTRSRPASCRSSWVGRPASSSTTWATARGTAPRSASGRARRPTTSTGSSRRSTAPLPTARRSRPRWPPFRGPIIQVPPAYTAIKVDGRRAYALARAGAAPTLAARDVTIHRLELVDWDGDGPRPADRRPRGRVLGRDVRPGDRPRPRAERSAAAAYLGRSDPDRERPVPPRGRPPARGDPDGGRRRSGRHRHPPPPDRRGARATRPGPPRRR